jgi:hypothetical protein
LIQVRAIPAHQENVVTERRKSDTRPTTDIPAELVKVRCILPEDGFDYEQVLFMGFQADGLGMHIELPLFAAHELVEVVLRMKSTDRPQ